MSRKEKWQAFAFGLTFCVLSGLLIGFWAICMMESGQI
jgi:hypothetical protein